MSEPWHVSFDTVSITVRGRFSERSEAEALIAALQAVAPLLPQSPLQEWRQNFPKMADKVPTPSPGETYRVSGVTGKLESDQEIARAHREHPILNAACNPPAAYSRELSEYLSRTDRDGV